MDSDKCSENDASGKSEEPMPRKSSTVSLGVDVPPDCTIDLAELVKRLLSFQPPNDDYSVHPELTAQDCLIVCHMAIKYLSSSTSVCVQTDSPINIVGDLHGQFHDLLRFFDQLGQPPQAKFLFLGDYVNKGKFSLEVIVLLLSLMLMYPDSVVLLRGSSECASKCSHYGFKDELIGRFGANSGTSVLVGFLRCFQWLPLAAIVGGKLLCCHGGVSPSFELEPFASGQLESNADLLNNKIERPFELEQFGLACDLLCSDPMKSPARDNFEVSVPEGERLKLNWVTGGGSCSYHFSKEALCSSLRSVNAALLVRGREIANEGFAVRHDRLCITLCSAPGYHGTRGNKGAALQFEDREVNLDRPGSFFVLTPRSELLSEKSRSFLYWHSTA
uniref:protein-serine/threonine phosphatase n=1 Tax=Macrostomum lignano TaxID=282301 RepID=A0A1I8HH36_9PLAT